MRRILVRSVIAQAARLEGLTTDELLSRDQRRVIAWPRQRAMYVARKVRPDLSYPRLGAMFGGRDHTTVLHAIAVVARRMDKDEGEAEAVSALLTVVTQDERAGLTAEIAAIETHLTACRARLATLTGARS